MTPEEVNSEFDLLYNNLASGAAPPLDRYEKSVFLTKAQEELLLSYYNGHNTYYNSFEDTEEVREYFNNLVKELCLFPSASETLGVTANTISLSDFPGTVVLDNSYNGGYWFTISENCIYKIHDQNNDKVDTCDYTAYYDNQDKYGKLLSVTPKKVIPVIPVKHDDLFKVLNNPFKGPSGRKAIRVSFDNKYVLYSPKNKPVLAYWLRYIKKPTPIILDNFSVTGETIDGGDREYLINGNYDVPDPLIRKIINRAVELAKASYVGDFNEIVSVNTRAQ